MQLIFNGIVYNFCQPLPPISVFSVGMCWKCVQVVCSLYVSHATKHCYAVLTVCTTFHGVAFFKVHDRMHSSVVLHSLFLVSSKIELAAYKEEQLTWFLAFLFYLNQIYTFSFKLSNKRREKNGSTLFWLYENWISDCDISNTLFDISIVFTAVIRSQIYSF